MGELPGTQSALPGGAHALRIDASAGVHTLGGALGGSDAPSPDMPPTKAFVVGACWRVRRRCAGSPRGHAQCNAPAAENYVVAGGGPEMCDGEPRARPRPQHRLTAGRMQAACGKRSGLRDHVLAPGPGSDAPVTERAVGRATHRRSRTRRGRANPVARGLWTVLTGRAKKMHAPAALAVLRDQNVLSRIVVRTNRAAGFGKGAGTQHGCSACCERGEQVLACPGRVPAEGETQPQRVAHS